jgi:DHA2 family multidrug resistance protein
MLASMMAVIDSTIASVALPFMQSSTAASSEQIMWVLTSYMIATAIAMPLSGWLANRFGRKLIMLGSLIGFTVASMLCGSANDLASLMLARIVQGACGAGLQPLSQAALLDINPPERHAKVLASLGLATMLGPMFGPTLGGWLTDTLSWRWVFFINVPIGVLAFVGLLIFLPTSVKQRSARFDFLGFSVLSLAVAALQLFLDRGEQLDWLNSTEIVIWAMLFVVGGYLTVVHTLTARNSFVRPELFKDWNFTVTCLFGAVLSVASFGTQPIQIFMLQRLMGYSALHAGTLTAVASLSSFLSVVFLAAPLRRVGLHFLLIVGMVLSGLSQIMLGNLNLYVDQWPVVIAGLVKGAGVGLVFTILPGVTFATLKPELRNEGAAIVALTRNLGMSAGISLMQIIAIHESALNRSRLVEGVRPDSPAVQFSMTALDFDSVDSLWRIAGEVGRQATMLGYMHTFYVGAAICFLLVPAVFLIRVRN